MSSDKDSVAPEKVWIRKGLSVFGTEPHQFTLEAFSFNPQEIDHDPQPVYPYIRDDGDLVSRSAVWDEVIAIVGQVTLSHDDACAGYFGDCKCVSFITATKLRVALEAARDRALASTPESQDKNSV